MAYQLQFPKFPKEQRVLFLSIIIRMSALFDDEKIMRSKQEIKKAQTEITNLSNLIDGFRKEYAEVAKLIDDIQSKLNEAFILLAENNPRYIKAIDKASIIFCDKFLKKVGTDYQDVLNS